MKNKLQVIPSGNPLVDLTWGGFYRGGTYFLLGPRKSGRTIFALQYILEAVNKKETCLYFSSFRPRDLLINAAAIDVDIQHFITQNQLILVRVTPAKNIEYAKDPDSYMVEYIRDIKSVIDQYNPGRIVFDELTPFIGFKDPELLKETFLETLDYIEEKGITSLFILSEPATPAAHKIVSSLLSLSTGYITLEKSDGLINKKNPGTIKITPNVGHVEGEFTSSYYIEPDKGIQVDYRPEVSIKEITRFRDERNSYPSLTDVSGFQTSLAPNTFYTLDDFKLLLNNQIAFYKQTGQLSTLIAVKIDKIAEKNKLLTIKQLANAIRLSIDKKDKVCILRNMVLVLFTKEDKDAGKLISSVINNLFESSPQYLSKITQYISLYSIKMDKGTHNAEDMFKQLLAADIPDEDTFGLN
jgi:KaiC/GvpD/RAD55 family RecA-like ATPase